MYGRISFLRDTKRVGDVSEIKVAAALVVAEDQSGSFHRIQVKTGRIRSGAIVFRCYSVHQTAEGSTMQRYAGQIDYFGVYCPDNRECYLVPVGDVGSNGCLRIEPCQNAQQRKIRWADPYLILQAGHETGRFGDGQRSIVGWPLPL